MAGPRSCKVALFAALGLCTGLAFGSSFSFTGTFSTDDQLQYFTFTLSAPSTITFLTLSYAGGTNQAGMVIPRGGFDPWLSLYSASPNTFYSPGILLQSVDNGMCGQVATDLVTGACFDSYDSLPNAFPAGTYTLILSQSFNQPVGGMLSDGFITTGDPTFTSGYGCLNGQFCDANTDNRNGNWAVDILNVTSASAQSSVPEPGTVVLLMSGIAAIAVLRRRKARS